MNLPFLQDVAGVYVESIHELVYLLRRQQNSPGTMNASAESGTDIW